MPLMTTRDVATVLRCAVPTVRKLIRSGVLPAVSIGGRKRIDACDVAKFIKPTKES